MPGRPGVAAGTQAASGAGRWPHCCGGGCLGPSPVCTGHRGRVPWGLASVAVVLCIGLVADSQGCLLTSSGSECALRDENGSLDTVSVPEFVFGLKKSVYFQ